jgi:metal-sulfur cluster biosynthetic enzyme
MKKEQLAKWLHDNYEEVAKEKEWNTQENCKVEFNALPNANKQTMIEMAERILDFKLLRLHFVSNWLTK